MLVFPTPRLGFNAFSPEIEARVISGGTALSGDEDVISTDGGGRWFVEASEPYLDDPEIALAWDALAGVLIGGGAFIMPLTDARGQMMGSVSFPIGGLPWWDESEFGTPDTGVTLAADADLRATTITLDIGVGALPQRIRPGQRFSIDHTLHRHRAYRVLTVSEGESVTTITFTPPLREDTDEGAQVDFISPKCVMRLDGAMRITRSLGFADGSDVRFVEHFPGLEGYE